MAAFPLGLHLGPFSFHLYGLGLALATYLAFHYAERRFRRRAIDLAPFARYVTLLLVSGLVGARAANIATNWSYYAGHYGSWLAVWQGGLASFGGIALALPLGLWLQRRWWSTTSSLAFADTLVVALVAGWALGRVLGPQFMLAGGGHPTHAWFGIAYHGQIGKRVPVPLIQAVEDGLLWLGLVGLEHRRVRPGIVTGVAMVVWGLVRALDEHWLLGQGMNAGSFGVQAAGLILSVAGAVVLWRSMKAPHDVTPVR